MTTLALDAVRSVSQNGNTSTFGRDPTGESKETDNPGWAKTTKGNDITTSWYGGSIGGDLGLIANNTNTGGAIKNTTSISIVDTLGNVITSYLVPAAGSPISLDAVGTYDEYGNTVTAGPDTGALSYNWLGGKERATNDITNLVLMGARLYNSITGLFTSRDPIKDGNTTEYTYPQDPINCQDLDGQLAVPSALKSAGSWAWKNRRTIAKEITLGVCIVGGFAACAIAEVISYGIRTQQRISENGGYRANKRAIATDAVMTGIGIGLGGVAELGTTVKGVAVEKSVKNSYTAMKVTWKAATYAVSKATSPTPRKPSGISLMSSTK